MSETSEERRARLPCLIGALHRMAATDDHEHAANLERCGEAGVQLVVRSVPPSFGAGCSRGQLRTVGGSVLARTTRRR